MIIYRRLKRGDLRVMDTREPQMIRALLFDTKELVVALLDSGLTSGQIVAASLGVRMTTCGRCQSSEAVGHNPGQYVPALSATAMVNAVQYIYDRESHVSTVIAIGRRQLQGPLQRHSTFSSRSAGHRICHTSIQHDYHTRHASSAGSH